MDCRAGASGGIGLPGGHSLCFRLAQDILIKHFLFIVPSLVQRAIKGAP